MKHDDNREKLFSVTLADCDVQTFHAGGKGGQNQNKRDTGCRVVHRASGAVGESREQRSQLQNKRAAFKRMTEHPKFKVWLNRELWVRKGLRTPEEIVESDMAPEKIRVEVHDDRGRWIREENRPDSAGN